MEDAGHRASEIASALTDKASNVTAQAKDTASDIASQAADKADDAMTAAGQNMQTVAETVRENAPSGTVGEVATRAASRRETDGAYLQQSDPAAVLRAYPINLLTRSLMALQSQTFYLLSVIRIDSNTTVADVVV